MDDAQALAPIVAMSLATTAPTTRVERVGGDEAECLISGYYLQAALGR